MGRHEVHMGQWIQGWGGEGEGGKEKLTGEEGEVY